MKNREDLPGARVDESPTSAFMRNLMEAIVIKDG